MKTICLAVVVVLASLAGCEDELDSGWVDQFGTAQNDSAQGLSADGRFLYAFGRAGAALPDQASAGGQDVYLRKYDQMGNVLWTRQFGTAGLDDSFWGTVEARDGRVIVAGGVTGALPGQTWAGGLDAFLRAYDSDGNVIWTRQFGTSVQDAIRNVALDRDGNIYVAAQTAGALPGQTSAGDRDAVVQKYDSDGNHIWTVQFGSSGVDEAIGVTVRRGYVYATGITRAVLPGQTSAGGTDSFVLKLSADEGQVEWLRQFGSAGDDSAWKVRTIGRSIFVSGHTTGDLGASSAGLLDPFLVRLNSDGDIRWIRQFGSPADDNSFAMTVHEGGIVMAGTARGALPGEVHAGDGDFYVRKYDPDGDVVFTLQWGTADLNALTAIASDGRELYVAGATAGALPDKTSAGAQDAVVVRIPDDSIDNDDEDDDDEENDD